MWQSGYLGNIPSNAFKEYHGKRAYFTGDIGYIKNENLYYKARKDKQIKYKGYRIELSDIEKNIQDIDGVNKCVVVANKNIENKVLNIIAFVTLKEQCEKNELEIKKELREKIPEYMCPKIKIISSFPLNKNGKCDEKRLLEEF